MEEKVELILQYVGDLNRLKEELGLTAVELLGGFAVIQIEASRVSELTAYPEIVYVETPKRLFFAVKDGKAESCINEVQNRPFFRNESVGGDSAAISTRTQQWLTGAGVLVAVIDSGEGVIQMPRQKKILSWRKD